MQITNVKVAKMDETALLGKVAESLANTDESVTIRFAQQMHRRKHPRVNGVLCMDQDPCDVTDLVATQVGKLQGLPYGVALKARQLRVGKRVCALVNGCVEFTQYGIANDKDSVNAQAVLHIGDGRVVKETPIVEFTRRPVPVNTTSLTASEFIERQIYSTLIPEDECMEAYHQGEIIAQVETILKGNYDAVPPRVRAAEGEEGMQLRVDRAGRVVDVDQASVSINHGGGKTLVYEAPRDWVPAVKLDLHVLRGALLFKPKARSVDEINADDMLIQHFTRAWEDRNLLTFNGLQYVRMTACQAVRHRCPTCQESRPIMAPVRTWKGGEWQYPKNEQRCALCSNIMLPLVAGVKYALTSKAFSMPMKAVARVMPAITEIELTRKLARQLAMDGRSFRDAAEAAQRSASTDVRAQA
jgi:hypothetical protein